MQRQRGIYWRTGTVPNVGHDRRPGPRAKALQAKGLKSTPLPMSASSTTVSTWAPLRNGVFRSLLAVLVSNVATWMQTVGAQWLLVNQPHVSILVALVETADYLPDMLFGIVGGVLADTFIRRRLMMAIQAFLVVAGVALAALTFAGEMLPAFAHLYVSNRVQFGARGAGLSVAGSGTRAPQPAALGFCTFLHQRQPGPGSGARDCRRGDRARGRGCCVRPQRGDVPRVPAVLVTWRPPSGSTPKFAEGFVSAVRAGGRYIRYAPVVRRILWRSSLFLVPASALWSLLPLVAIQRLGLGADGYGLLLGVLGAGAIAGAVVLPGSAPGSRSTPCWPRAGSFTQPCSRPSSSSPALARSLSRLYRPAWRGSRSFRRSMRSFSSSFPRGCAAEVSRSTRWCCWGARIRRPGVGIHRRAAWNRADLSHRGGRDAGRGRDHADLADHRHHGMDRTSVEYWREPSLAVDTDPQDGPVVVNTVYTVEPDREPAFLRAMANVRLSRLRTGGPSGACSGTGRSLTTSSSSTWCRRGRNT